MWDRIPFPVESEQDRRELCAILSSVGLEVRVVRERPNPHGTYKKYVEYEEPAF